MRSTARGGCWNFDPGNLRSANRGAIDVDCRFFNVGLRVAFDAPQPTPPAPQQTEAPQ